VVLRLRVDDGTTVELATAEPDHLSLPRPFADSSGPPGRPLADG